MQYADRHGLDREMAVVFERVIRELDEAYLAQQRDEQRARLDK